VLHILERVKSLYFAARYCKDSAALLRKDVVLPGMERICACLLKTVRCPAMRGFGL
jgi:hypothetical protein